MAVVAAAALCPALLTGASAVAARRPAAVSSRGPASAGTWGKARKVPGLAALSKGGSAQVTTVSCASAGNCSAGGYYTSSGRSHAFVVSQKNGTWGTAEEVSGTAALKTGSIVQVNSVSCASAGNCSAGGEYSGGSSLNQQAFVVSQKNGTWGKALEVPGTAALNTGGGAQVISISCASAGNCSAVGPYRNRSDHQHAFVVSQKHGTWGTAEEVPGTTALNGRGRIRIYSVSCGSAGNCSAGGDYTARSGHNDAFVVSQKHGIWGNPQAVPGIAARNRGGNAAINSVSCASAGNCSAGGYYENSSRRYQAFVVSQENGAWGNGEKVPGTAVLDAGGNAWINSVSCASAGNCSAGGWFYALSGGSGLNQQAFVVNQEKGIWGKAEEVPGAAALNTGGFAAIFSVSCASAGNCSAGGNYSDSSGLQALVVSQENGTWGKAEEVRGTAALNTGGDAGLISVSCAPAGNCSAGGYYEDGTGRFQAFVVSQTR